jgi:hypothetical protein
MLLGAQEADKVYERKILHRACAYARFMQNIERFCAGHNLPQ